MFTLATLIFQGILINSNRKAAWRTMAWIVLLSLIVAGTTYSAAIAAEPIFPGLSIPSEEHHEHEESEDHHEEATPPAEHDH